MELDRVELDKRILELELNVEALKKAFKRIDEDDFVRADPLKNQTPPEVRLEVGKWYRSEKGPIVKDLSFGHCSYYGSSADEKLLAGEWTKDGAVFVHGGYTEESYGRLIAEVPAPRKEGIPLTPVGDGVWDDTQALTPPPDPLPKVPRVVKVKQRSGFFCVDTPNLPDGEYEFREVTPRDAEVESVLKMVSDYYRPIISSRLALNTRERKIVEALRTLGLLPKEGE